MTAASPRRRRREAGLTLVGTVLILALFALAGGIVLTGQLAVATSRGGQAQHGADAAALAGAQAVLDEIPTDLAPGFLVTSEIPTLIGGGGVCLTAGQADAARLAAENGDQLTSYCYDSFRDEIRVEVETGDHTARKAATAATTFDAGSCSLDADFEPAPPPGGSSDGGGAPAQQHTLVDCGITGLQVLYDPVDSRFRFVDLGKILGDVQPRLTR
ncbi:MAG TPA: hypothetical protein VGC57_01750 [Cellulomonas sp.]